MKIMKHKIPIIPIFIVFLIFIALIVIVVSCGSKPIKANTDTPQIDSYELYVLDVENKLTFYNIYKVKSENIYTANSYGNIITTYNATDGTRIIFANNGVTVISPKGYEESFTQGYMKITRKVLVKAILEESRR